MSEQWQQIAVWVIIILAGLFALYTAIRAWRLILKGECSGCPRCATMQRPKADDAPGRLAFLDRAQLGGHPRRRSGLN